MRINRKLIKYKKTNNVSNPKELYITCEFRDRFGNNMFQIANVCMLSKKYKTKLVFNTWKYSDLFEWDILFDSNLFNSIKWNHYLEKSFRYNNIVYNGGNVKFHGYYQSYKYLDEIFIKSIFKIKDNIIQNILDKYNYIFSRKTTSIHVRRTDYLYDNDHPFIGNEYYNEAMQKMNSITDLYVVFSDDIEWCKHNITSREKEMLYIENNQDYIDLFLMSMCDNNIIANSSFSWWGAYLNKNDRKKIICPLSKNWFSTDKLNADDICPTNWIKI